MMFVCGLECVFSGLIAFEVMSPRQATKDVSGVRKPLRKMPLQALLELDPCPETKNYGALRPSSDICVVLHHRLQR